MTESDKYLKQMSKAVWRASEYNSYARGLIGQSKALEAKAKKFWGIADAAQKSIEEWQNAGLQAAAYKGWEYHKYFTPPPSLQQTALRHRPEVTAAASVAGGAQ